MSKKAVQISQSILNEADKVEEALLSFGNNTDVPQSIVTLVVASLKNLETAVALLIINTDPLTNELKSGVVWGINYEETKAKLQKISLLARRVERELAVNQM